jgi:hypothetical protein
MIMCGLLKELLMHRFLSSWFVWLILGVISLSGAKVPLPLDSSYSPSTQTTSSLTTAHANSLDVLFKESSSTSQQLSILCERESKQGYALARSVDPARRIQEREGQPPVVREGPWPVLAFFCLRKLFPPSDADDPSASLPLHSRSAVSQHTGQVTFTAEEYTPCCHAAGWKPTLTFSSDSAYR